MIHCSSSIISRYESNTIRTWSVCSVMYVQTVRCYVVDKNPKKSKAQSTSGKYSYSTTARHTSSSPLTHRNKTSTPNKPVINNAMSHNMFKSDDPFPVMPGSDLLFSPSSLAVPLPPTPSIENQQSARKRQRTSTSPAPSPYGKDELANVNVSNTSSIELAKKLGSENPDDIVEALNYLLTKSVNHDINYSLGLDGHKVIDALVQLYDETIGWTHGDSKWVVDKEDKENDTDDLKPSSKTWECNASPSYSANCPLDELDWQSFCATKFAPSTLNTACAPSHVPPRNLQNDENDKEGMKVLEIIMMVVRNLSYGK